MSLFLYFLHVTIVGLLLWLLIQKYAVIKPMRFLATIFPNKGLAFLTARISDY